MNITVIKLGGSLIGSNELSQWLLAIETFAKSNNIIVVPGGGVFADSIREQQQRFEYSDEVAHRQALLSMCQTGYLFKEYCDALQIIETKGSINSYLDQNLPLVWLPFELLEQTDSNMQNWDYTSDSMALWLSNHLQAQNLILVKQHRDSVNTQLINYINNGIIDKGFHNLTRQTESNIYVFPVQYYAALAERNSWAAFKLQINT